MYESYVAFASAEVWVMGVKVMRLKEVLYVLKVWRIKTVNPIVPL